MHRIHPSQYGKKKPRRRPQWRMRPSCAGDVTEVVWDWQFIIPTYDVLREYGYRARVVYCERCSREKVLKEFRIWRESLEKDLRGKPCCLPWSCYSCLFLPASGARRTPPAGT